MFKITPKSSMMIILLSIRVSETVELTLFIKINKRKYTSS